MNAEQPNSTYIGRHAELYDLFYAGKLYVQEAAFVHSLIQKHSSSAKHILELACGTGTHCLILEKYGYQITATDYSQDMLSQARIKGQRASSSVKFSHQDMRYLDVPDKPFDAVYCLFDSIGYVATNENLQKVLEGVGRHLKKDGLFIFEFWHAGAMISGYEPLRVRRWPVNNGKILRISETQIDYKSQLCHVAYSIYELNNDGSYKHLNETHLNRFFLMQEMAKFLTNAGFTPLKWFSGFTEDENITNNSWHIVSVARFNG